MERVVLQMLRTELVDTTTLNGTPPLRDYVIAQVRDYLIAITPDCGIT